MVRFAFNIRTRAGQRVDNISIMAASQEDAERRLRQMYHQCEILRCQSERVSPRGEALDVEGVIGLISGEQADWPAVTRLALRQKPATG